MKQPAVNSRTKQLFAEKRQCAAPVDDQIAARIDEAYRRATEALERLDKLEPHVKRPGRPRVLSGNGE